MQDETKGRHRAGTAEGVQTQLSDPKAFIVVAGPLKRKGHIGVDAQNRGKKGKQGTGNKDVSKQGKKNWTF